MTNLAANKSDWMRPFRYLVRVPLLIVHAFINLPITLILINPLTARIHLKGESFEHRVIRWWQGGLLWVFGFRVNRQGEAHSKAALFVANHVSWLDINLLHSQRMVCFVAKAEIARWPLIGWMALRGGTIYHQRGSSQSLSNVSQVMVDRMRSGLGVGVFPEGGTGPGDHVRTFHGRIFQSAIDAQVPVQPVAFRFTRYGQFCPAAAFRDGENFLQNFLRLLGEERIDAEVIFLPIITDLSAGRRRVAEQARVQIVQALGYGVGARLSAETDSAEPATDDLDVLTTNDQS